jgi:hypothetical protein
VYSRLIQNKERFFGVSGLLYRSNVLMYDRETESLWSQLKGEAVTGKLTGTRLEVLPSSLTTWGKWRKLHPDGLVLSTDTGYSRNYTKDPYLDYYARKSGFWSFFKLGPGEKEKELVIGIELDGQASAYPLDLLRQRGEIRDAFGTQTLKLDFDSATDRLQVTGTDGSKVPYMIAYWFVWKGIHPQTGRYK